MSTNNLPALMERIAYFESQSKPVPHNLTEQYLTSMGAAESDVEKAHSEIVRSKLLFDKGNLSEAVETIDDAVAAFPGVADMHVGWRVLMGGIANRAWEIGTEDPACEEFGRVYEALKQVGYLSMPNHLIAVEHYRLKGAFDVARTIADALAVVAPNMPGFASQYAIIQPETYGVGASSVGPQHELIPVDLKLVRLYGDIIDKLNSLTKQSKYADVLELAQKVMVTDPVPNGLSAEIYYWASVALDYLEKHLDALQLITKLVDRFPAHSTYAQSYGIIGRNVFNAAAALSAAKPDSTALRGYFNVLESCYFSPLELIAVIAKQEVTKGNAGYAKSLIANRLVLSPNDTDYLKCATEIASMIHDTVWASQIHAHIEELARRRPHDLALFALLNPEQA